ncbi:MAG TPA: hypothetical protein VK866_15795 [Acidimicrobiales bacterium]|nr:hypothetical protein [Acidimicrobiales bacterium]
MRPVVSACVVALLVAASACGGDDGPDPDPVAFCELGPEVIPVEDASPEVLRELADVADEDLRSDLAVLIEAAARLAGYEEGDPAALQAEFEIRFDSEYAAARDAVESAVARCARTTGPTITTLPGADATDTTLEEDAP